MAKGFFSKDLGALRPADDDATEILRAIGLGEVVEITIQRKRNPKHHRKLFALLKIVVDNTDGRWPSVTAMLEDLKMAIGLYEKRVSISGKVYYVPQSISWASQDQITFSKTYDQMLDVVVSRILPGVGKEALEREVLEIIGGHGR